MCIFICVRYNLMCVYINTYPPCRPLSLSLTTHTPISNHINKQHRPRRRRGADHVQPRHAPLRLAPPTPGCVVLVMIDVGGWEWDGIGTIQSINSSPPRQFTSFPIQPNPQKQKHSKQDRTPWGRATPTDTGAGAGWTNGSCTCARSTIPSSRSLSGSRRWVMIGLVECVCVRACV